jgi:hypothetical protein
MKHQERMLKSMKDYAKKNKIDIVELVQLYNVDHVFDRLRFRHRLDYTK